MMRSASRSRALVVVAGLVVVALVGVVAGGEPSRPWHLDRLVGIEVGPTGANPDPAYMSRMTGKDVVEKLLLARAEYGVLFLKDM